MAKRGPETLSGSDPEADRRARAVRDVLPTSRHAQMLFEAVVQALGGRAVVETYQDRTRLLAYRRDPADPEWIVPWHLLELALGTSAAIELPDLGMGGEDWQQPRREAKAPSRLRNVGRADLAVTDGWGSFAIRCADDGNTFETSIAGRRVLDHLYAACGDRSVNPVEALAARVIEITTDDAGDGRVHLPVALPSISGVLGIGVRALRGALWHGQVPADARAAAMDGYSGEAMAFAATRAGALAEVRGKIAAKQPRPATPKPPPEDLEAGENAVDFENPEPGTMSFVLRAPPPDVPRPQPALENTPIVAVPLAPPPAHPCPFGRWVGVVDRLGTLQYAAIRHEPEGFTLVGAGLLAELDLAGLDALLAGIDEAAASRTLPEGWRASASRAECSVTSYRLRDPSGQPVRPHIDSGSLSPAYDMRDFDATTLAGCVVRQRWIGPPSGG